MSPSRTTKIALGAAAAAACALLLAGCSSPGSSDPFAGFGPDPTIPPPHKGLLPQIGVPEVVGWSGTAKPVAPDGFTVTRFADGLDHPRWLLALPNGDVLVAEAAAPPKAIKEGGFRAWAAKLLMSRVGATTPSADRITLLRDADGDGVAETKATFAQGAAHGLKSPFGMTLVGETLYVANADGVVSFPYRPGQTSVTGAGTPVFSVIDVSRPWVDANPKESDFTYLAPGQPVTVTVDAFPDHVFKGMVGSLSPGTGAQFAILPPQNATGNFVKIVQRVPVRIYFDENDPAVRKLKAGMSSYVSIDTGHSRSLAALLGLASARAGRAGQ